MNAGAGYCVVLCIYAMRSVESGLVPAPALHRG